MSDLARPGRRTAAVIVTVLSLAATRSAEAATPLISTASPMSPVVDVDGVGYFSGWVEGTRGPSILRTDGTNAGTTLVATPYPGNAAISNLTAYAGKLYFTTFKQPDGSEELWESDGTNAGTRAVLARPGTSAGGLQVSAGGTAFVTTSDGSTSTVNRFDASTREITVVATFPGQALRSSAPTADGGVFVWTGGGTWSSSDLSRVAPNGEVIPLAQRADASFGSWKVVGNDLYFAADDGVHGTEPWVTDGTKSGTRLIADLTAGEASSRFQLAKAGGSVYATAAFNGTYGAQPAPFVRLSRAGATPVGTGQLSTAGPGYYAVTQDNDVFLIPATDWSTTSRTVLRASAQDDDVHSTPVVLGKEATLHGSAVGLLYQPDAAANELRLLTRAGSTVSLARPRLIWGSRGAGPESLYDDVGQAGGLAYFTAATDSARRLWRTDGTPQGTWPIVPTPPKTEMTLRYTEPAFDIAPRFSGSIAFSSRAEERCRGKVTLTVRRDGKPLERLRLAVRWDGSICSWSKAVSSTRYAKRKGKPSNSYTARATFPDHRGIASSHRVAWNSWRP